MKVKVDDTMKPRHSRSELDGVDGRGPNRMEESKTRKRKNRGRCKQDHRPSRGEPSQADHNEHKEQRAARTELDILL